MSFSFLPYSFKQSINNCVKISVRTSASGELPAWGQLKSILTYALGVENIVSGLNHNLEYDDFLKRTGNLTCFNVNNKINRKNKREETRLHEIKL